MKLKVLVRPEEVGGFSASVPALPGCFSEGESLQEVLDNTREAAELWLETVAQAALKEARAGHEQVELQEIEL